MTNQLSHANLFSDLSNVTLRRVFRTDQGWIMEAHGQNSAACPGCQSISRSRHSRYWRSLKDLPVQGTQVILRLRLGRWRCPNARCQRRIFTERLSKICGPYAQQTKRTGEIIAAVGERLQGQTPFRFKRMGFAPVVCPTSKQLENLYYPTAAGIASAAYSVLEGPNRPWAPDHIEAPEILEFKGPF